MKKMYCVPAVLAALLLTRCGNSSYAPGSTDFVYHSLKELKFEPADLKPGSTINILGFSGGKRSGKDTVYYSQFLVTDNATGDTLKILTPMISVDNPAPDSTKTYTMPMQYDMDKGVREATFEPMDSVKNMMLDLQTSLANGEPDKIKDSPDKANKTGLVIYDPGIPQFEKHYKTAIGVLNFKQQPW